MTEFEYSWQNNGNFYYAGCEMFGREFEIRLYVINKNKYLYEVYDGDKKVSAEFNENYKNLDEAKLKGEKYLTNSVDDFMHKIGYYR